MKETISGTISGTKTIKFIDRKHVRNNKFMNKKKVMKITIIGE
ncbi:hypothetical protein [uncultured Eubacterium sp.]|nr:hypothetical protein [uncultured Eubacterium sp.]